MKNRHKILVLFIVLVCSPIYAADSQSSAAPATSLDISQPSTLDFANGLYARRMYGPAISEYEKFIQSNPKSEEVASARFRIADSYYFMKNYKEAALRFESFIKNYPREKRRPVALFRLGATRFNLKDLDGSQRAFLNLSDQSEDPHIRSGALFYMAKIDGLRGRTEKNRLLLDRVMKGFPQTEYAAYAAIIRGDDWITQNKPEEAIAAYRLASDRRMPAEVADEASFKIAEIYFSQKKFTEAKAFYERIYDAHRQDAQGKGPGPAKTPSPFLDKALAGIFYCEYQLKQLDEAVKLFNENAAILEKSAGRLDVLYLLANLSADAKKHDDALGFLDRVMKDPEADKGLVEKALFKKAAILKSMDKKDAALVELQKIIDARMPAIAAARFEQGEILSDLGRFPEAAIAYQASLDAGNDAFSKAALYNLAGVSLKQGVKAQARVYFMSYIEKYPGEEDAQRSYLQVIQIDLDLERFEDAVTDAKSFIQKYPQSAWLDVVMYKLGMGLGAAGHFEEASKVFGDVISRYPASQLYPESVYGMAANLESFGKVKEAIEAYGKFIQSYPNHGLAKQVWPREAALYVQSGDFEKAASLYEEILVNRADIPVNSKTTFWVIQQLLNRSRYDDMQKIRALLPKRYAAENLAHEINFFTAESYMGLKDYAKAVDAYSKSIEVKPNGDYVPHATLGLGIAYAAQGNLALAEANFAKAMRYDDEVDVSLRARFEIANLKLRSANYSEAAKAFMMVAVLYDDEKYCPIALYKAGKCFKRLGDTDEAQKAFQELQERYPASKWAKHSTL